MAGFLQVIQGAGDHIVTKESCGVAVGPVRAKSKVTRGGRPVPMIRVCTLEITLLGR